MKINYKNLTYFDKLSKIVYKINLYKNNLTTFNTCCVFYVKHDSMRDSVILTPTKTTNIRHCINYSSLCTKVFSTKLNKPWSPVLRLKFNDNVETSNLHQFAPLTRYLKVQPKNKTLFLEPV